MTENPPTPETRNNISRVKSAQEIFELLAKIFVIVAAVLYVTGFLIVSTHLARYGVHSFSILRAQYILAGAWFFAHILIFVPIALVLRYLIQRYNAKRISPNPIKMGEEKWTGIGKEDFIWLVGLSIYILLISFKYSISIFTLDEIYTIIFYLIMTLTILAMGFHLWEDFPKYRKKATTIFGKLLLATALFFIYTTWFSRDVYLKIPAQIGGGMPVKVQFHWKDECKTKDIAAAFKKECKLKEEPVVFDQILATDTDHVIISPCPKEYPRTFEISNDLIDYVEIQYEQKKSSEINR